MGEGGWPQRFLEGVRLFNEGHFFETHEVWEDVWRAAPAEERDFYQGMIHLTVALYQAQRENWRAAHSQLGRAARRLERYEPWRSDLDIREFRALVSQAVVDLAAGSAARFPKIQLTPAASPASPPAPKQKPRPARKLRE